jgi:hypothetical protein
MKYAHAEAINAAREALESINSHAGTLSFGDVNPGGQGHVAQQADVAKQALTQLLITAKVFANDAVAGDALR